MFTLLCFLRTTIYLCKRSELTFSIKKQNIQESEALDYIQDYVINDKLDFIIDNHNRNSILYYLSDFIKQTNSQYKEDYELVNPTAKKLKCISFKFICSLYHKSSKEDIFNVLLKNSQIINKQTKIR